MDRARDSLLDRLAQELETPAYVLQDAGLDHALFDPPDVVVEEQPIGVPEVGLFRSPPGPRAGR